MTQSVNVSTLEIAGNCSGSVTLVGAGPGDPELLTLKAVKAIGRATVLLVDDLVNDAILAHADSQARIIHVGKRGGCQSTPQSLIEKLMIHAAVNGETVVRLKGGDPFIFGRGGEEVLHLRMAGIKVDVINGITSGLAAATSLDIPLTHRDQAHGVVFITGHNKPGGQGNDWAALAACAHQASLTMVIYMGVASADSIMEGLLKGLPGDTPVAIVQNASLSSQRHAGCVLRELVNTIKEQKLASPSVMIVGKVASGVASISQLNSNELIRAHAMAA
jgi:uroporphyrin-III C-methyltransferase